MSLARERLRCDHLLGPRSISQLEQNLADFDLDLPADIIAHLSEVSEPTAARH